MQPSGQLGLALCLGDQHRITSDESPEHQDRKSTRLNSSHANISYAVFCLKKKDHMIIDNSNHAYDGTHNNYTILTPLTNLRNKCQNAYRMGCVLYLQRPSI